MTTICRWIGRELGVYFVALLSVIVLIVTPVGTALGDDWPQYRGINRDGTSAETGWLLQWPPTNVVWQQPVEQAFSSTSISQGRAYTMGWANNQDTVYCFDAYNGNNLWSYTYAQGACKYAGCNTTPCVDTNYVYTFGKQGDIYCFDKVTGTVIWHYYEGTSWYGEHGDGGSPLVDGDVLILTSGGGKALNKNTGAILWSIGGTDAFSSPKVLTYNSERIVLMVNEGCSCYGVDETSGSTISGWGFGVSSYGEDPEFYGTNMIYSASTLYQMTSGGLTALWSGGGIGNNNAYSCRLVYGNYAYGLHEGIPGGLRCISLTGGALQWEYSLVDGDGALMASDNKVILWENDSSPTLTIFDAGTTSTSGRAPYTFAGTSGARSCPVLANGLLYIRPESGPLYCINLGAASHGGAGVVQFGSAAISVGQMAGSATITLTRTNGISGAITVNYATANGTAVAGTDYVMTTGTLTFAADQANQSFSVPILNNGQAGPNKTVNLTLSNPTGGATLGSLTNAVLTIVNDNGAYRMKIGPFNYSSTETLTNFPALVVLSTNLSGFSYSQFASTNGYDLRFSTSDNSQELNYEVEKWNTNGSSYVWVQVPQLQSGTYIWASWDNSAFAITSAPAAYTINGATWPTASYAGVWHMDQLDALDSTANRNNGYGVVGTITNATGLVDGADGIDNGYIEVADSTTFDSISSAMTVSGWVCFNTLPSGNGTEQPIMRKDNHVCMEATVDGSTLEMRTALHTSGVNGWTASNDDVFNPALNAGQWYYLAFTYSSAAGQLWNFENGLPIGGSPHNVTGSISANNNFLGLAGINGYSLLNAILDEVRVEQVFRSTNWMWASYLTVASNASFSAYGPALTGGGGGTNYTINAVAGPNGSITPSGYVLVALGTSQSFTISPNTYCTITNVLVDGSSVGTRKLLHFQQRADESHDKRVLQREQRN